MNLGIAIGRMILVVFEAIEVLVAFATVVAAVRFVLFHADGARVWGQGIGIDDGVGTIFVGMELLRVVSVL